MTVKKAIELLSQMPPEAILVVDSITHGELDSCVVPAKAFHMYKGTNKVWIEGEDAKTTPLQKKN